MLNDIKVLLGLTDSSKDDLLNVLINQVQDEVMAYTHRDNICGMQSIIVQMVVYRYNLLGVEGLKSESYDNLTFDYVSDYPAPIYNQLKHFRKLRTI